MVKNLMIQNNYDSLLRPPGENPIKPRNGSVNVYVNLLLRSLSHVNEANMEYTIQMTFRQQWKDSRVAYEYLDPNGELPEFFIFTNDNNFWRPDTFFVFEKNAHRHNIDKPNVFMRIHRDGTVLYSVRLTMVMSCPMQLAFYPMDEQICHLDLASYAYTVEDITYFWKEENAIQLKDGLSNSLPQFVITNYSTSYCTSKTNTGEYSCLRFSFRMQRSFGNYLLHLFLPSGKSISLSVSFFDLAMMVGISWISFYLDPTSVPGRVTLMITTLLTLTTKSSGVNAKLPPVNFLKAIDYWIMSCTFFIVATLLEFAVVTYLYNKQFKRGKIRSHLEYDESGIQLPPEKPTYQVTNSLEKGSKDVFIPIMDSGYDEGDATTRHQSFSTSIGSIKFRNPRAFWNSIVKRYEGHNARKLDLIARIVFPLGFFLFNVWFWWTFGQQQHIM
uniref:Ig-like domain-containing protein n=1 Tax=Rhabditophanes sp. KR3021 TaxID=114890 RepID=A0AC35UEV4_9BILA